MQLKLRQAAFKQLSIAWNSLRVDYEQINLQAQTVLLNKKKEIEHLSELQQALKAGEAEVVWHNWEIQAGATSADLKGNTDYQSRVQQ